MSAQPSTKTLETERLVLRELTVDDAAFILALVNEPAWLRFIGDRGVRTLDDARDFLRNGPIAMYARTGHGLWLVAARDSGAPLGICGLLKREALDDVDIGFAFRSVYWGHGYALEAAAATLAHGRDTIGLTRIVAILAPGNERSERVVEKLGFRYERRVRLAPDIPEVRLFAMTFAGR